MICMEMTGLATQATFCYLNMLGLYVLSHLYVLGHGTSLSSQFISQGLAKFVTSCLVQHLAQSEFPINDGKKCKNACLMGTFLIV